MRRFSFTLVTLCLIVAAAAVVPAAPAQTTTAGATMTWDFKDPKGVNAIGFFVDSELEPIMGVASGLEGMIAYDPANPNSFSGALRLPAGKVQCSNPRMTSVLQGADWLDIGSFLTIEFTFDEVLGVRKVNDTTHELRVKGRLGIHGVTIDQTVNITANVVPDGAKRRGGGRSGDLLMLRSRFSVDRSQFEMVSGDGPFDKVGKSIDINVAIAGYAK